MRLGSPQPAVAIQPTVTERSAQLGHASRRASPRRTPGARRDWKPPRVGRFSFFQARFVALRPRAAQKNPHVCVLNLAGSVSGHGVFTNPQVDGLRDFRLRPPAGLKRKHAPFLRAGRPKGARNPPSQARIAGTGRCTPKRLLHPAHHTPKRPQHPAYHAPKRLQRPTRCVLCLQPSTRCPGTFGFHTAVCQSPTVCHTPCLLARMVSHAIACNAT